MSVFIVTYDLAAPHRNYEALLHAIKVRGQWAKLSESSYLTLTNETAVALRDRLLAVLHVGDKIFVGTCPSPSAWYGLSDEVGRWILANQ